MDRSTWAPGARDLVAAAAVAAVASAGAWLASAGQDTPRPPDVPAYLIIVAGCASLAWWRAAPLAALAGSVAAVGGYLLAGYPYGPIQLCLVAAMFAVAVRHGLRLSLVACGLAAAVSVAAVLPRLAGEVEIPAIVAAAWASWLIVPWSVGALLAARAAMRRSLVARVALEERVRLSREVHDAAGHGLAVIAMQAGVALTVLDDRPDQARDSLRAIRTTSTRALDELRRALEAGPDPGDPGDGGLVATPGVRDLPGLVDGLRAGGLPVDLEMDDVDPPAAVDAAIYRVVQESLTNVVRHARSACASVRVRREADEVVVEIADRGHEEVESRDVPGEREAPGGLGGAGEQGERRGAGRGLRGMRARVAAAGGSLDAGTGAGGGFTVRARFPGGRR